MDLHSGQMRCYTNKKFNRDGEEQIFITKITMVSLFLLTMKLIWDRYSSHWYLKLGGTPTKVRRMMKVRICGRRADKY